MIDQLPFNFSEEPGMGVIITPENELAIKWIKNWPNWPKPSKFLNIFGPTASGKSIIGRLHRQNSGGKILTSLAKWYPEEMKEKHFILDEVSTTESWSEEALFFLYQAVTSKKGTVLILSQNPISSMAWQLADLRSRFRSIHTQEILPLLEKSIKPLLEYHLAKRQCSVSPTVLNFLLPRVRREYSYIQELTYEINMLSLKLQQSVTIGLVKQVLIQMSEESKEG